MTTHYIAMAGLHGYMPNVCESYDNVSDAIDSMVSLHELGKRRISELKRNLCLELNIQRDGNEYIEISECDCDNPSEHNAE